MSIPRSGHLPAASTGLPDHSSTSDSDAESETEYRPISGAASDTDTDPDPDVASHHLDAVGNGISALDLSSDEEEEEEERQIPGEAAAAEDVERRRRATLPVGAAARVVDAMRGVAFPGAPPSWATSVPEDQWINRLRSLRGGPN